MKILGKTIYYACLIFLVLAVILLLVSALPVAGNFKIKIVLSGSMKPTIKTGSLVIVKPSDSYRIGDIITFQKKTDRETTTHRIEDIRVQAGNPLYITKGDSNNAPDKRDVSQDDIIGKVLFAIPYFGYVVSFIQKPIGFAIVIIVPAIVVIIDEIKKIYGEIKKKNKKADNKL